MEFTTGIYEQLINEYFISEIESLNKEGKSAYKDAITHYDPQAILSRYLHQIILKALHTADERSIPVDQQVVVCNEIIHHLACATKDPTLEKCKITREAEILFAIIENEHRIAKKDIKKLRPITSIAHSSLFTGSSHEPSLVDEWKREIKSADRIDLLISFIKWSGIRLIIDDLREFVRRGELRIITTSYTGATDLKAIDVLSKLPNTTIKISYDTDRTRLHAKTYTFHRKNGFSTSYIGSSNLSNPAITSGLEWNVKVTEQDSCDIIRKIDATFESYWNDPEFIRYRSNEKEQLRRALSKEKPKDTEIIPVFDIKPYYYQKEILDTLKAERSLHGNNRNLIVAATGTGKTIISAFDYKDLVSTLGRYPRLLFVVHREEILKQSLYVFRGILKDPNFGDLMVGGNEPSQLDYVFTSIQSFNSKNLSEVTAPDYYDMIIVDEFHHAAAPSYQKLLTYYTPKILLGLTATPERMDGLDILQYFHGKITAEIRLPEAINRKLLAPFHYFGVTDVVDLDEVPWKRGRYDPTELSKLLTGNRERVEQIIKAVQNYTTDIHEIIGLGFCVSIEHAEFMAALFTEAGIPSECLHNKISREERFSIQKKLVSRQIHFIFVVDLYNEGIDIPEVNTILFLRPTESLTVFLQQLGRGLRLSDGKECLTVLDFVGRQNKNYQFGKNLSALLSSGGRSLYEQVSTDSYDLPKGCHIHLEKVAQKNVLENIKANLTNRSFLLEKIRSFQEETGKELNFKDFMYRYSLRPIEIYRKGTFSSLAAEAGVYPSLYAEDTLFTRRTAFRLASIDSPKEIQFIRSLLSDPDQYTLGTLSKTERSMLTLFYYSLNEEPLPSGSIDIYDVFSDLFEKEKIRNEICDLLAYNAENLTFLPKDVDIGFESPLELHCRYTRDQIFAALGHYTLTEKPAQGRREGVLYLPDKNVDVFLITLNKTEELYSPTTMYKDYAVNERLFHWQSQSTTSEGSQTGQRYIEHEHRGIRVLIFVREFRNVKSVTQPYMFLGTARYISHEGSRPMSILWELDHAMPSSVFMKANTMLVG
ncbi:MAG: DUF3427 domain-containing protein [Methanofollis sp.]|nr:DUF3427 domain-containing protein [Methanofollis sp.]